MKIEILNNKDKDYYIDNLEVQMILKLIHLYTRNLIAQKKGGEIK